MCQGIRLLALSTDPRVRATIASALESEGHHAHCVATPQEAEKSLADAAKWDYVLLDASDHKSPEPFLPHPLMERIGCDRVYILTELGDVSWKGFAKKWNITGILTKPLLRQDCDKFTSGFAKGPECDQVRAIESPAMSRDSPYLLEELDTHGFFLAASSAMIRMHKEIRILASVDYPLLILGESGVGKEIVARLLHKYSPRSNESFVNVNTAAIPSELLESELFGFEAGAFTGAIKAKPGKFELANRGTLLLDEIGEMSMQMQAKLLHVLQDGSFSRLGARDSTRTDVRILAATNVNMEEAIAEKRFREDLYYRLNAFTITVPSLHERREEIPYLMEQMMIRGLASTGREPQAFSSRLLEAAQEYHWPGNLRELRNFVTRLLVLQDQDSAYEDLRAKTKSLKSSAGTKELNNASTEPLLSTPLTLKGVVNDQKHQTERRMIKEALSASGWNRRRAASSLKISYRALLYKIQQHNLTA